MSRLNYTDNCGYFSTKSVSMDSTGTNDAGLQPGIFPRKYYNRWIVLMFFVVAEAFVGLVWTIDLLSRALKNDLGLSQAGVNLVSSFGHIACCLGFICGGLFGAANTYRYFAIVAVCLISGGLLYMSMAMMSQIPASLGIMCAAWFFINFGVCIFAINSCTFNLINFPRKDSGKVCGLVIGILGLSPAVLAIYFSAFFEDSVPYPEATFALSVSIVVFIVVSLSTIPFNLIPSSHVDYVPEHAQGVVPSFRPILFWFYGLLVLLIAFTVCDLSGIASNNIAFGIIVLVIIFCGYAIPSQYGSIMVSTLGPENNLTPAASSELASPKTVISEECESGKVEKNDSKLGASTSDARPPSLELPWYGALRDRRFWAVFISFFACSASGVTLFNNVTAIATSLGVGRPPALVGLMGLGNATARLVSGVLADILHRHGIPRSFVVYITLIVAAGNSFLLSMGSPDYLYVGFLFESMCLGSMFSTVLGLMADYFGTKHIGTIYGIQNMAPASSSFAISTALVSVFYKSESGDDCIGRECYQGTFIIMGCLCTVCIPIVFFISLKPDYVRMKTDADIHRIY